MSIRRAVALPLVFVLAGACGSSDDPFTADMKMICNVKTDPNVPPDMQAMAAYRHIADNVRTAEAARLVSEIIQVAPADRPALLAPALAKAKLKRCRFFER